MDNSELPITISEIPPERQSSGLSLFSKLGDRRDSGNSNSFFSSQNRSQSSSQDRMSSKKSFTQTFIEDWLVKASSSSQKSIESELPPWASNRSEDSVNATNFITSGTLKEEGDDHSIASLKSIIDEAIINDQSETSNLVKKSEDDLAYSIIANELLFPEERVEDIEDKITSYTTAQNSFSSLYSFNDKDDHSSTDSALYQPHSDPEDDEDQYILDNNSNTRVNEGGDMMSPLLNDRDLLDTVSYVSENGDSLPDTVPYRSDNEYSLPDTIPYKSDNEDDLSDTAPYTSIDLPDITPYGSQNLSDNMPFQSNIENDVSPGAEHIVLQSVDCHSIIPSAELPPEQEPLADNYETWPSLVQGDRLMTSELTQLPHALELRSITENLTQSTDSTRQFSTVLDEEDDQDYFDTIADEEIRQLVDSSMAESATKLSTEGKRKATSPLLVPAESRLAKSERKQLRGSTIKKPATINDYFSHTTGLRNDTSTDAIGKDSETPSYTISNNQDLKKADGLSQHDHRRRPRFGISKRNLK